MKAGAKIDIADCEYRFRAKRCDDCGFTKGTEANLSGVTAIKAQLCAEVPTPFLCHFNAKDNEVPDGQEVLCQGWVETCNELAAEGFYKKQPDWQREWKLKITDIISDIENAGMGGDEAVEYFQEQMRLQSRPEEQTPTQNNANLP